MSIKGIGMATLLTIGASLALASPANAELIQNGDFVTNDFTGWSLFTTANGTLGHSPAPGVVSFDVTGSGAQNAARFQVGQETHNDLTLAGGGITQSIATVAGLLEFSASIAANTSTSNVAAGVFSVLLDGTTEDTIDLGGITSGQILRDKLTFSTNVSAGSHIIELLITRPYDTGGLFQSTPKEYITAVSADVLSVDAVPEPSTWAMMILGFAGISFIAYRRKSKPALMAV